jgi:glycosyltransferase involved in cell wall biosynthesis
MAYNEEVNLRRCLDSVAWSNDVVILDSHSQDRTVAIANSYLNTRVFYHRFDDYSRQRNYGLHEIGYINPWVLILDADEAVEPELSREILDLVEQDPDIAVDVFLVRRKVVLDDRRITRNSTYDFWIERLLRPRAVHYEGTVHEKLVFEGGYRRLTAAIEHHQFAKGIPQWFERRLHYARIEASGSSAQPPIATILGDLFNRSTLVRRSALKRIFNKLPYRWLIYLIYNLVVKLTFLDGVTGLRYVLLESRSQYLQSRIRRIALGC